MSWWSRHFGKQPKDHFLEFHPFEANWRVVSWNFDVTAPGERLWAVENHGPRTRFIRWRREKQDELSFFDDKSLLKKASGDEELKTLMNLAVHSSLKYSLEHFQSHMLEPVPGATTLDFQNEARALQWIQASFGTLTRALDGVAKDSSLILTAGFFAGIEPTSGDRVLRLIAFNLDIFYYLRPDFSLQIIVYDDKDMGQGRAKAPTFQQIIKVTKPQFYDEMVKLVHRLAAVGEIK